MTAPKTGRRPFHLYQNARSVSFTGGEAKRLDASESRISRWLLRCGCRSEEVRLTHDVDRCRAALDAPVTYLAHVVNGNGNGNGRR